MGTGGPAAAFDGEMEVAAFIAFENPGRGRVEAVTGPSPPAVPPILAP